MMGCLGWEGRGGVSGIGWREGGVVGRKKGRGKEEGGRENVPIIDIPNDTRGSTNTNDTIQFNPL